MKEKITKENFDISDLEDQLNSVVPFDVDCDDGDSDHRCSAGHCNYCGSCPATKKESIEYLKSYIQSKINKGLKGVVEKIEENVEFYDPHNKATAFIRFEKAQQIISKYIK